MRRKSIIGLSLILLAVVGLVFFRFSRNDPASAPPDQMPIGLVSDDERYRAEEVYVVGFEAGGSRKQWELRAASISENAKSQATIFRSISDGRFFTDDGTISFEADEVVRDDRTGNLVISGNVSLVRNGDVLLRTSEIRWASAKSEVICPNEVVFELPELNVTGDRMSGDMKEGVFVVEGNVKATATSGAKLDGERLVYYNKDGKYRLDGFRARF